ncbi:hypothetical protein LCGC14_2861080 [marine sediment metagenome]|uniref:Uncharacterized protein n=1 Tax=marine sediment metagenome TaxID=412755 RepID=A0A0F9ADX9_9ZZZZ
MKFTRKRIAPKDLQILHNSGTLRLLNQQAARSLGGEITRWWWEKVGRDVEITFIRA